MERKGMCLIVVCGLPGVGKSTFVAKILKRLQGETEVRLRHNDDNGLDYNSDDSRHFDPVCICYDNIIPNNLYKEENSCFSDSKDWKQCRGSIVRFVQWFITAHQNSEDWPDNNNDLAHILEKIQTCHKSLCLNEISCYAKFGCSQTHIILIDDNMFYSSMRYEYYKIARKYGIGYFQIHLTCSMDKLQQRNSNRLNPIAEETIRRMASKFEVPSMNVNAWENNTITINTEVDKAEERLCEVIQMVKHCLQNPVESLLIEDQKEKERAREINVRNILHQTDLVLRTCVSVEINKMKDSGTSKEALKAFTARLTSKKKKFLAEVKTSPGLLQRFHACLEAVPFFTSSSSREIANQIVCNNTLSTASTEQTALPNIPLNYSKVLDCGIDEGKRTFEKDVRTYFYEYKMPGDLKL